MIIRFFKFTKSAQVIVAMIVSLVIMLALKNQSFSITDLSSLLGIYLIFFLSLFIISKNTILKTNQYITIGLILFSGVYFKMPFDLKLTASYFFLLLSIRRIYSLKSKKNLNEKFFDIGLWFSISTFLHEINIIFFITILSGSYMFYKLKFADFFKILTGYITASIIIFVFLNSITDVEFSFNSLVEYLDLIWIKFESIKIVYELNLIHWSFAIICTLIFTFYMFNYFGSNLSERIKSLFLMVFFINSMILVLLIKDYSIFLFFPFLVTLIKIISDFRHDLFFEITLLVIILINSYPF